MILLTTLASLAAVSQTLTATGHDKSVYLRWEPQAGEDVTYTVERAPAADGPWVVITEPPVVVNVHCDWIGENGLAAWYRVAVGDTILGPVSATTIAEDDEALLDFVQEATFRYFWDGAHSISGMAYERYQGGRPSRPVTTGGTGFGLMALLVGAERGFVTREACAERVLKLLTFLEEDVQRYHGVWSHWLDGATGETIRFARKMKDGQPVLDDNGLPIDDDGGDIVETAFLVQGILATRQYFDADTPTEAHIRETADRLWREVQWDWYLNPREEPDNRRLYWHWSRDHDFGMNHKFAGWNECMIAYLLGIASPTHPLPADAYEQGWITDRYANGKEFYGRTLDVGPDLGGPMFWTHYSFLGFDPHGRDKYCNYFDNSRTIALIHHAYCDENPQNRKGLSSRLWGLTASDVPDGYRANRPGNEDGTIAPTAALSSMPYAPAESRAMLRHLYDTHGAEMFGPFGFRDAINLDRGWVAKSYLAIDQGPIVCMIENHRTGLLWDVFMSCPELAPMMDAIGWTPDPDRP